MRLRSDLVLETVESACFLLTTGSEGFGGSLAGVAVGKESFAAVAVRSGMSAGGVSFFSAGGDSAFVGAWLVSDGPSAGTSGSAIRLLTANWGEEEVLSATGLAGLGPPSEFAGGIGGEADCCAMLAGCSGLAGEASAVLVFSFTGTGAGDSEAGDA